MPHSSPLVGDNLFISKNYIVTEFNRLLDDEEGSYEMKIEVRSNTNFTVIHTFEKEILRGTFSKFRFFNDILSCSIARVGEPKRIK